MKAIVIYNSAKGSTKKYAEWISKELHTEAIEEKALGNKDLSTYDLVIYGGWIFGGRISGLDQIKKRNVKNLIVYAVGLTPVEEKNINKMREDNQLGETPFFYFPGAMQYSKQGFIKKMMLKMVSNQTLKNPNSSKADLDMANKMLSDFDDTDIGYIQPLLERCMK